VTVFLVAAAAGLILWAILTYDPDRPRRHRARTYRRARKAAEADGYQAIISHLWDDDFAQWTAELDTMPGLDMDLDGRWPL
jgi:hypothetical protein